ncbi:MAG: DUF2600 family protein [Firmicutes bacterium]|jgi:tetraprenyl-beta-curcumene synthase|nr:DUF2600 family protein [Bacillota bacterium]NLL87457.1 DUF2600 family protein [Bacillota bacterium]HKM18270.1 DUF2600 family protein [Limnochordia bacterium]
MQYAAKAFLLRRYLSTFGLVKKRLEFWKRLAGKLPSELQKQALASIEAKAFHCLGGAVYAVYPQVPLEIMLDAIVALQTISDYLDNLCDRMQVNDEQAFQQLHLSFAHALDPSAPLVDYYSHYPYRESVYLTALVETCRQQIRQMPYYAEYKPLISRLASYYCRLQVLKHLSPSGPSRLEQWVNQALINSSTPLLWNEWAAAAGSTLGIFCCFAASFHRYPATVRKRMYQAYFPWIQSLHILLDYFIDRQEDQAHGDLNFTFYHANHEHAISRIGSIYRTCKAQVASLPHSFFHQLVLDGLTAMYGSDPKLRRQGFVPSYSRLLDSFTPRLLLRACRFFRTVGILP